MAELSNTLWMIPIVFVFAIVISQDTSLSTDLNNATFECRMSIDAERWIIKCESETFQTDKCLDRENCQLFFSIKLQGKFQATDPVVFDELLKSTSFAKSKFCSCDSIMKTNFQTDPCVAKQHCVNLNKYIRTHISILKPSFVTRIRITHTSNFELMANIFRECSRAIEVKVCNNSLSNLIAIPVAPVNSIRTLILEENKIENIAENLFNKLTNLTILDLSKNSLKHIDGNSFSVLRAVTTLDISFNLIETMTDDVFSNMTSLKKIYLQSNNLQNISESIFQSNKLLQEVNISNNSIVVLPSKIFRHLFHLNNVSCSNCSLYNLDVDLFVHSSQIEYIEFSHNHIQSIPDDIFKNLKFLKSVNLGFNSLKTLNGNIFRNHIYLNYLYLTHNDINFLQDGIFDGAPHINVLDLSRNKMEVLTDDHVKSFADLEYLDMRQNRIVSIELGLTSEDVRVRRLRLSDNLISNLTVKWKSLLYLEDLEMDNNQLTYLDLPPCIPSVKQTITFSFKNNKISKVNLDSLISDEIKVRTDRTMTGCFFNGFAKNFVDITNNPLVCDCYLYTLYKYVTQKSRYQLETFLNTDNLTCAEPQFLKNKYITSLKDDAFSCSFSEDCPSPCTCAVRGKDNMKFVNCSENSLQNVPQIIPEETTVLYFNKNKLKSMISLNSKTWSNLVEFHLDDNLLTDINDWLFPASLRFLSVRGNKLKTLPSLLMQFISNQTSFKLYFGGNDKNCTCDRKELQNFLIKNKDFIGDADSIVCEITNNETSAYLPLSSVPDSELCPRNFEGLNYSQKSIIISLCVFFTFFILVMLTYYKQRQLILSFCYIHCNQLFRLGYKEDEFDEDKIFDAFVAYSSSDRDIVMDLLEELENHPPYFNLCIHERNWLPGRFICDNILSSVTSCKRIIVVLSSNFISSPWFNLELRAAVSRMSKEKISRIIIILTEKTVSLSNVDPELRHVISKRTYLVWKERWFWQKLRYAMPRNKRVRDHDALMSQPRRNSELSLIPEAV